MSNGDGLPKGWVRATVEDIVDHSAPVMYGILQPGPIIPDGVPYIRPTEIDNDVIQVADLHRTTPEIAHRYKRSTLAANDVILSIVGTIGKVAIVPPELTGANITQSSARIRVVPDIVTPRLIAWALRSPKLRNQFDRVRLGTAVPRLNIAHVRALEVHIPPLNEQRRIVAKIEELFSDLDAGVAALERARANLKRYRAAVLKAAVEGRLTAEWRAQNSPRPLGEGLGVRAGSQETAPQLLQRILKERRRKWEEAQLAALAKAGKKPPANWKNKYKEPAPPDTTDLPELPEGWCWGTVEQLLVEGSCNGISVKGSNIPPGIPALRLSAMSESGFDYSVRRYIPISEDIAEALAIAEGDFFVARGNGSLHLVGRGTLAQPPVERIVFPDTMIRLRLSGAIREYIALIWHSRLLRRQIEKKARTTAGIYKISQRDIDGFIVPLPPLAEQEQIVSETERRLSIAQESEFQIEADLKRSVRLRQSILKRAFEGRLVPQDPNDEPASVLLERIRNQRMATEDNGQSAKGKSRRKKRERTRS